MNLGQQLKALRKSARLTYRDLQMHHNTIKAIETGRSFASLNRYLERLQNASGNHIEIQAGWAKRKEKEEQTCTIADVVAHYNLPSDLEADLARAIELGYKIKNGGLTREEYEEYDHLSEMIKDSFL